jgi:hypothetical protein
MKKIKFDIKLSKKKVKNYVKTMSKSCQKVVKVVKKLSNSCQTVVKSCQKVVTKSCHHRTLKPKTRKTGKFDLKEEATKNRRVLDDEERRSDQEWMMKKLGIHESQDWKEEVVKVHCYKKDSRGSRGSRIRRDNKV